MEKNVSYLKGKNDFNKSKINFFVVILMFSLTLGKVFLIPLFGRGYSFQFAEIIILIGLIIFTVHILLKKPIILFSNDLVILLWVFLIMWTIAGTFWVKDYLKHWGVTIWLIDGFLTYIIIVNVLYFSPRSFQIAERLFIIGLVVQLIINVYPFLAGRTTTILDFYSFKRHAITMMGNSNYIAIFLEFSLIFELVKKSRNYFIFVLLAVIGLTITLSRTGLLILLIFIPFIFLMEMKRLKYKKVFLMFIVFFLIVLFIFKFMVPFVNVLQISLDKESLLKSFISRKGLMRNSFYDFTEAPLIGSGLRWEDDPHNIILRIMSNLGIIGGIPFFIILLIPIKRLIHYILKKPNYQFMLDARACLVAYLVIFLHSMLEPFFMGVASQIWIGIFMAYVTIITNNKYIEKLVDKQIF